MVCCATIGAARCVRAEAPAAQDANSDLVQMVASLLGDPDPDVRAIGQDQVRAEVKGTAATQAFVDLLPKLSPEGQAGLLSALGDRGDRAARPGVLKALSDSQDDGVRVAAIRALGALGNVEDIDRLVAILAKGPVALRAAAIKSITQLQGDGVSTRIAWHLGKHDAGVGTVLIEILATRRALDTIPALLQAANGDNPSLRAAAMQALSEMADPSSLPELIAAVLKAEPGKERDAAERAVARICEQVKDPDKRAETLLAEVRKRTAAEQVALLPMLGRVGGGPALAVIEAAIADTDARRHDMGIRALCQIPHATIAPRLIEVVEADEHPRHREMALAAVVRVAPYRDERTDAQRLALLEQALALSHTDAQRDAIVKRAGAIRSVESLRFLLPYTDNPRFAETACLSIVELAHHRGLRVPNAAEFAVALDKVIATSKDPVVVDRATRYKAGRTWKKEQ